MTIEPDFNPKDLERAMGGPVLLDPVASGQSNPTWFVTSGDQKLVLRKKPAGATLNSAHAIEREYRVMKALSGSGVPVPAMIRLEEDASVIGTPFYLMQRMAGQASENSALPDLSTEQRGGFFAQAADILARLHRLDWQAAGLSDFGRSGDYYARQVRRWVRQWQDSGTRKDAVIDGLADWFAANIPAPQPTTIVHGDFRVGNLLFDPAVGQVSAVLDWELSTLGDPLADLAHWCMFYDMGPDQLGGLNGLDLPTLNIPDAAAFLDMYRQAGGCDAPLTPFHRAFALFRMSVIFEGIAARVRSGQAVNSEAAAVGALAPDLARLADAILSGDRAAGAAR